MNASAKHSKVKKSKKTTRGRLFDKSTLQVALLVLFCAVYTAALFAPYTETSLFLIVSVALIVLCVVYWVKCTGAKFKSLFPPFALALLFYLFGNGNLVFPAAWLAILTVSHAGAMLLLRTKKRLWLLPALLLTYLLAFCATLFRPVPALFAFSCFPVAFLLAYGTAHNRSRIGTICLGSAGTAVPVIGYAVLRLWQKFGATLFENPAEIIRTAQKTLSLAIQNTMTYTYGTTGTAQIYSYSIGANTCDSVAYSLLLLTPAALILLCNLFSYFVQHTLIDEMRVAGPSEYLTPNTRIFNPSTASAILFLLSLLATVITGEGDSTFSDAVNFTASNLLLILGAAELIFGYKCLSARLSRRASLFGILIPIFIGILAIRLPFMAFILLAIGGAVCRLVIAVRTRKNRTNSDN